MNEAGNINRVVKRVMNVFSKQAAADYEIIFVDDGSTDGTAQAVKDEKSRIEQENVAFSPMIHCVSFSRNFGHQVALKAGIDKAQGDCVISMDGDLQHPPELIPALIDKWQEGHYDIVYTVRQEDPNLPLIKRITSKMFYKFINSITDLHLQNGCADFRLIDRKVADVIKSLQEPSIFFRGMVNYIGFSSIGIPYTPDERTWGNSKYSMKKMIQFAIQGITSFSIKPLCYSLYTGCALIASSIVYLLYNVIGTMLHRNVSSLAGGGG